MQIANPGDAAELYQQVYAQHCRMCHTNIRDETRRFDTYRKFIAMAPFGLAFERGTMPAARLTMDRFWAPQTGGPVPAQVLAEHIGLDEAQASGPAPLAQITQPASDVVERRETFRLSAHDSVLASSFAWDVAYEPSAELVGAPSVLGYEPTVVGDGTPEIAFRPEHPGTYTASLVINDPADSPPPDDLADSQAVTVENYVPLACNNEAATTPGGADVVVPFLQDDRFSVSGSGDTCASGGLLSIANGPDVPVSYSFSPPLDANGQLTTANGGTFLLAAGDPCSAAAPAGCADDSLAYTPSGSGASYRDQVTYALTDADGDVSGTGTIAVDVTAELIVTAQAPSDPVSAVTTPASAMTTQLNLAISGGVAGTGDGTRYTVTMTDGPSLGTVTLGGNPIGVNDSFTTDDASPAFEYTAGEFEVGPETVGFTVADSNGTQDGDVFSFEVLPQAPFDGPASAEGQLGSVMNQWASQEDGKTDCMQCHGDSSDTTGARAVLDLVGLNANDIYLQLVPDMVDLDSPQDSRILCYPSGQCGTTHTGGSNALPPGSTSYAVIERWIEEGALAPEP